jgi:peroxiredoxin
MSKIGEPAPDFTLQDHFGRDVQLSRFRGKKNVLLLFYPLDWTPT